MMISMKTGISWCDATLNPWVGCVAVSPGCDNCYAKRLVTTDRAGVFGHPFEEVRLHLDRLTQLRRFKPIAEEGGAVRPRLVFVNSISDFFFEQVPDRAIHAALDHFEWYPRTIFQILTKRPIRARKLLVDRYHAGFPRHIWIGVSCEDNRVAARLNVLRSIKDRTGGGMTAFVSVEPIIGPTDAVDFAGCDWVILGGESGPGARVMQRDWLLAALAGAQKTGARIWLKQHGTMHSHPNLSAAPPGPITRRFQWLIDNGFEQLPQEKGGATCDRAIYRDLPLAFDKLKARLSDTLI